MYIKNLLEPLELAVFFYYFGGYRSELRRFIDMFTRAFDEEEYCEEKMLLFGFVVVLVVQGGRSVEVRVQPEECKLGAKQKELLYAAECHRILRYFMMAKRNGMQEKMSMILASAIRIEGQFDAAKVDADLHLRFAEETPEEAEITGTQECAACMPQAECEMCQSCEMRKREIIAHIFAGILIPDDDQPTKPNAQEQENVLPSELSMDVLDDLYEVEDSISESAEDITIEIEAIDIIEEQERL